jgi:hypothetical protein
MEKREKDARNGMNVKDFSFRSSGKHKNFLMKAIYISIVPLGLYTSYNNKKLP